MFGWVETANRGGEAGNPEPKADRLVLSREVFVVLDPTTLRRRMCSSGSVSRRGTILGSDHESAQTSGASQEGLAYWRDCSNGGVGHTACAGDRQAGVQ